MNSKHWTVISEQGTLNSDQGTANSEQFTSILVAIIRIEIELSKYCLWNTSLACYCATVFCPRVNLRGQGGPDMINHRNRFYGVFWKRGVRSTSCFLPDKKILILAEVIVGQRSVPMCNSIVRSIFIRVYLKKLIFQTSKLSSPTVFEQSSWNFQDMF